MNTSKIIEVNVDCDVITKEVYMIVLESILKYILYQFQQIPVHIDVLEKELNKTESSSLEVKFNEKTSNENDATDSRQFLRQKALERRAVIAKKTHERKRSRWLIKVKKFVENFQTTMKVLQEEMENSVITSTVYSVGSTPFTPKFMFKILVPFNRNCEYFKSTSHHPMFANLKRKVLSNLLRSFANNNEISKFSSSTISLTKLWTLFEKENPRHAEDENLCPEGVMIRPDFKISSRTKVIQVVLKEKAQPIVEMELTPCVGVNPSFYNGFVKPSVRKKNKLDTHDSFTTLNIYNKHKAIKDIELSLGPLEDGFQLISSDLDVSLTNNSCVKDFSDTYKGQEMTAPSFLQSPRHRRDINFVSNKCSTPEYRTPCRMVDTISNMIETPVVSNCSSTPSPVKRLSESITDISFSSKSNTRSSTSWYQIDFALSGFKEIY